MLSIIRTFRALFLPFFFSPAVACQSETLSPGADRAIVIAHRGSSFAAPEHTTAAFDLALEQGADYIELDVARTRDSVLVIIHDATADRTLTGPTGSCTGRVADRSLAELRACDAGSWFNTAFPARASTSNSSLRILTLAEAMERYASRARFYIEIKDPDLYPGIERDLSSLLESKGLRPGEEGGLPRVIIQSFDPSSLRRFEDAAPGHYLILLIGVASSQSVRDSLNYAASLAHGIGPRRESVDEALVAAAHDRCLAVHPYTVNDEQEMLSLLAMGVDGIFTDRPDALRRVVDDFTPTRRARRCS